MIEAFSWHFSLNCLMFFYLQFLTDGNIHPMVATWDDPEVPRPKMRSAGGGILTFQ